MSTPANRRFIGLMSGTSLDGVDAALVEFDPAGRGRLCATHYLPFSAALRDELLALNSPGHDEIARSCLMANRLAELYADSVTALLAAAALPAGAIDALGAHGQTIRHRPELGYTVQLLNASLLAELSGIRVVADFRSRDIAAGGQGAPLVPAFHQAAFAHPQRHRVIVNIGGISNLSDLPPGGPVTGFDCGLGNLLLDGWIARHRQLPYDAGGAWAASGQVLPELLQALLAHPFFALPPPKSTGRDTFHLAWLEQHLPQRYQAEDVQATLLELTAANIVDAILRHCAGAEEIYLCGGGAKNGALVGRLRARAGSRTVALTDDLGIAADWVEAAAFAWLARQALLGRPGNLPGVTGARGARILGAIHPAGD